MTIISLQGHGSTLEIDYVIINKNDIKSRDDLYQAYLDSLISYDNNRETYFSTLEYQDEDGEDISVTESLIKSSRSITPEPDEDNIVIASYNISKKGYLELEIDSEVQVDVSYSQFLGYQWIQNIKQDGQDVETNIEDYGRPNEEGVACYVINSVGGTEELSHGVWYYLSEDDEIDEDVESSIRETTDQWYELIFN